MRIVIIGAGFAGLGAAIRLRQAGIDDFEILERSHDLGGTWRDNSYPGCAVDVQSHLYSYSFAPNPDWSQVYSPQEEIWAYIRRCAEEHDVPSRIRFGHEVTGADWDDERQRWSIETSAGHVEAQFLISGMGPLSHPALPDIPGLDDFAGTCFHSARWDHDHDLTGERVAVIGTGCSAAQLIPEIQPRVERLLRLPAHPGLDVPADEPPDHPARALALPARAGAPAPRPRPPVPVPREHRLLAPEARADAGLEALMRLRLRRQVPDPELRAKLTPTTASAASGSSSPTTTTPR